MHYIYLTLIITFILASQSFAQNFSGNPKQTTEPKQTVQTTIPAVTVLAPVVTKEKTRQTDNDYRIGIQDELNINVLQLEAMALDLIVSPDGTITFPYIGNVDVKGKTAAQAQDEIQKRLADGYLKYPVVTVAIKQSYSKKFFVYGEVEKPGPFYLDEQATVLKAISAAGGLTRFGSSSRVKILRQRKDGVGYEIIKVDIKAIMDGQAQDVFLQSGDIVQVEEGIF